MPTYSYFCDYCLEQSNYNHGMNESVSQCVKCNNENTLRKIPSNVTIMKHKDDLRKDHAENHTAGEVVKQSISEIQEEVKKEKELLKQRVWELPK